jgi:hypothetical protein
MDGLLVMRTWKFAAAAAVGVLAVVGCSSGSGPEARLTPSAWPAATGDPFVIEPSDGAAGSETFEMDGVAFSAPEGWEPVRSETERYVQITIDEPGGNQTGVLVTITKTPGDPDLVEELATAAFASLAVNGATSLERRPASWKAWAYATAITATVDPTGDESLDYVLVIAMSRQGFVVGVSAQCAGKLDGSQSLQVLQSLRAVE